MAYISFQPSDYFNTKLYTGNGSTQSITGVGFQPDWTWIKERGSSNNHELYDAVRGATKRIFSDATNAEDTNSTGLTAFGTDGFTLGGAGGTNNNSDTYVAWNWKANGSGSANGDGSINSTVSVNTIPGFSIVSYTGTGSNATVGHGLGVAPSMIITKSLVATQEWCVYHKSLGATKYLFLNETSAEQTGSVYWQDTTPTSSVFSIGASGPTNSTSAMIAYCFAEIKGYSKIGSYKGNGSTWGPFINCGFKPAWVLWKRTDSANGWILMDNKRPTVNSISYGSNPQNTLLEAQSNAAEASSTSYHVNFLSNGFKVRNTNNVFNNTSGSYIYLAFADHPLVSSNGVAATGN